MEKRLITVVGGTGQQGGGVVDALLARRDFKVRVPTRDLASKAAQALAARDVDVVKADFLDARSLRAAFAGAYGAFVVTNYWDAGLGSRETEIGAAAVKAARAAGVEHLVWSTLPDVEKLSGGRLMVPHFTGKARVDSVVRSERFPRHSFVQAPFYFQNLLGVMAPQSLPDGRRGWVIPIDPAKRVIHAGDVTDIGLAVAAAFAARDELANDSTLAVCGGIYSWNDFVSTLTTLGHELHVVQMPAADFDRLFPGASEVREMFQYFEAHTYFGPQREDYIARANRLVPGGFSSFADWARVHMRPS